MLTQRDAAIVIQRDAQHPIHDTFDEHRTPALIPTQRVAVIPIERVGQHLRSGSTRRLSVYRVFARPTQWRLIMSDSAAMQPSTVVSMPVTLADVLRGVEPMGDLSVFVIDDLTVDEEDAFFATLEDA